jgi:hypothetical protein
MARGSRSRGTTRARPARARAPPPRTRRAPLRLPPLPRALTAHPDRTAAGLFALLVLVYLWPVLLGGKVFSPAAVLYKLPPWRPYQPHDVASYENYLLADVPLVMEPWRAFARAMLHAGTLPAWNPHVLTGVPFFSNPQTGLFSPFSLPLWVLPLDRGLGVSSALILWAAAFGAYLLVRELGLGFLAGLLAGVAFAFCSTNVMLLTPQVMPSVLAMLPWMLWLVERTLRRGSPGSALGLALVTAIALGGGHPGMQVHVPLAAACYALLRAALMEHGDRAPRLRRLALAGGGMALGGLLMAVMLVPEVLASHGTIGTNARAGGQTTLPGAAHMPLAMARTVLFPDWWGRPSAIEAAAGPTQTLELNYQERTFYAGVVTLLLACVALTTRRDWRAKAPFAVIGVLALAITIHTPGLFQLVEHLPVLELVENQRLHAVFELMLPVLGAFGLQELLDRPRGQRARLAVPLGALAVALIAAATAGARAADVGHTLRHFLTGADFQSDGVLKLTSVAWFALFALAVGAALALARRRPQRRVAIATALVLLATLDALHFAHGYNPMGPASKAIPPRTPAIAFLQRHAREGRIVGLELALPADWSLHYGLFDVRSYDPPYPTERYFALWREANPEQVDWKPLMVEDLGPTTLRVTGALGARWIVAEPGTSAPGRHDPWQRELRAVYRGRDATIFEDPRALPRALVAPAVALVPDAEAAARALVADAAQPRRTVVVERDQPGVAGLAGGPPVRGSAAVTHETDTRVTLRATLERRGLVVLSDQLTDGWSVRVDGRPARALHADDVMRGVVVPAGRHTIVWRYAMPGLRAGIALSLLALAATLAAGAALVVRARRRAP